MITALGLGDLHPTRSHSRDTHGTEIGVGPRQGQAHLVDRRGSILQDRARGPSRGRRSGPHAPSAARQPRRHRRRSAHGSEPSFPGVDPSTDAINVPDPGRCGSINHDRVRIEGSYAPTVTGRDQLHGTLRELRGSRCASAVLLYLRAVELHETRATYVPLATFLTRRRKVSFSATAETSTTPLKI